MTGSTRSSGGLDDRRKRLLFRCWHRGTREMDLILGRFADAEIAELTDDELAELEQPDRGARSRSLCRPDRRHGCWRRNTRARCSTASRRFAPWITTHEGARSNRRPHLLAPGRALTFANVAEGAEGLVVSDLARAIAARPKPPAVSLAVVCRDGPRMQQLARALEFFAPDLPVMQFPAWDCQPYDRVSPHGGILAQRLTTLARLARLTGSDKPLIVLTTVNAIVQRVPAREIDRGAGAVGRAGPRRADGLHRRLAGAQRLQPLLDRARARRICRARRHPRSVSGRTRPAGALRFLRRQPGIDPHLRCRDPAHAARHALARSGADLRIPAGHRNHPPLPDGLCRGLRRARARRSAL